MSYLARSFSHESEVRLLRWSDSPRGATITVELPPIEVGAGHPFKGLEGVRFRMRFDPIRDDETVEEVPAPSAHTESAPESGVRATGSALGPGHRSSAARERYLEKDDMQQAVARAGILCGDKRFQEWIADGDALPSDPKARTTMAAIKLRYLIGVESRKELASDEEAVRKFLDLEFEFHGYPEQRG